MPEKEDDLYQLLHSLAPTEKRYIRIFASKHMLHNESSYLKLLDIMLSMEHYDKNVLNNFFAKSGRKKQRASDKNYLYSFVLKAMRSFHEEKTVDTQLRELLTSSSFLYEKRLYDQGLKLLNKAKKLAISHDRSAIILDILFMESKNLIEKKTKNQLQLITQTHEEVMQVIKQINEEWPLIMTQQKTFILHRMKFSLRNPELVEELNKIVPENSLKQPIPEKFTAAYYYLFTVALYYQCLAKFEDAATTYEHLLELWSKHPAKKQEASIQHKKCLANYLSVCHSLGRYERFSELIEEINSIPCTSQEEEAEQFQNVHFAQLLFYINTCRFNEIDNLTSRIKAGMVRYKTKINKARELAFSYNISIAYFLMHRWKDAIEWADIIVNNEKTDHRQDIQCFARLFRLVLLYESGKHDLLEYEIINTERYLRSRKNWFAFESAVVKHLKKCITATTTEKQTLAVHFRQVLENFRISAKHNGILGLPELICWAESAIKKKRMMDIVQAI